MKKVTNGEKYAGSTHNHYVFERVCPRCNCFVCGREPSDLRECLIKDVRDYQKWSQFEYVSGADFALVKVLEAIGRMVGGN